VAGKAAEERRKSTNAAESSSQGKFSFLCMKINFLQHENKFSSA